MNIHAKPWRTRKYIKEQRSDRFGLGTSLCGEDIRLSFGKAVVYEARSHNLKMKILGHGSSHKIE